MLKNSRGLVEKKQQRRGRRRLYAPRIKWASWLLTGGDQDEALPVSGRKANRRGMSTAADMETAEADASDSKDNLIAERHGQDEEKASQHQKMEREKKLCSPAAPAKLTNKSPGLQPLRLSLALQCRGRLADAMEWVQESDDFLYALKLTVAVILVSWPAWIPSWTVWYSLNRGCELI